MIVIKRCFTILRKKYFLVLLNRMQLFISTWYELNSENIVIHDPRIVHQCFHVLRYTTNQQLQLQDDDTRYTLLINQINKKTITTHIIQTEKNSKKNNILTTIIVALPNRRDKAELIVQKLTEIGIDKIVFRQADRSIIRQYPDKKHERLQSISIEAAEQCFRRDTPEITYIDNIRENPILNSGNIILFQHGGENSSSIKTSNHTIQAIIGPEWWFSSQELDYLTSLENTQHISLWKTILRMETAAIIGWWLLTQV